MIFDPLAFRVRVPPRLARALGYTAPLALFALFLLAWEHQVTAGFAVTAGVAVLGATLLLVPPEMTVTGLGGMADENAVALVVLLTAAVLVHPALTPWVLGIAAVLHAVDPLADRMRIARRDADSDAAGFDAPLPIPADSTRDAADGPQVPLDEDPFGPYPDNAAEAGAPGAVDPAHLTI